MYFVLEEFDGARKLRATALITEYLLFFDTIANTWGGQISVKDQKLPRRITSLPQQAQGGKLSSQWQEAAEGDWEHLSSTSNHPQSHRPQSAPTQRSQHTSA